MLNTCILITRYTVMHRQTRAYFITEHFDFADSSMHWFSTGLKIFIGINQKMQRYTCHSFLCREICTQTVYTEHQLQKQTKISSVFSSFHNLCIYCVTTSMHEPIVLQIVYKVIPSFGLCSVTIGQKMHYVPSLQ